VAAASPPETDALARALALLERGAWKEAHGLVQDQASTLAAWLHGIVHTLEGDLDNARYWYRRAHRRFHGPEKVHEEIGRARRALAEQARAEPESR
jgi:hypothetical protein